MGFGEIEFEDICIYSSINIIYKTLHNEFLDSLWEEKVIKFVEVYYQWAN